MAVLRLGIVGCGRIAEQCHIPAALSSPDIELVAVAESNPERLDFVVRSFGLSCLATTSAVDLKGRVDAVMLLLPNHLHQPVGCEFLQDGVHVLCEKPLAKTKQEAQLMCEAAEAMSVVLAVGYVTRFYPSVQLMKKLLDEGFLGPLHRFDYELGTPGGWAPISAYNLHRDQAGGGVLVTSGSHFLDRMLYWFGYPSDVKFSDDSQGGIEANCSATFTFEGGFTGEVILSKTHWLRNRFRVSGERGSLEMGERQQLSLTFIPRAQPDLRHEISANHTPTSSFNWHFFQLQIEDFGRAIHWGTQPRITGRQGLASVSLVDECYRVRTSMEQPWVFESLPKLAPNRGLRPRDPLGHPGPDHGKARIGVRLANGEVLSGTAPDIKDEDPRAAAKAQAGVSSHPRPGQSTTMTTDREVVLVTGSTGFIGSRLCEVCYLGTDWRPRPFIHSPDKASYIARYPLLDFALGDLTDFWAVRGAMEGCTSVVHLARGSNQVMLKGLRNVLRAAVEAKVRRFVHVSSVAVYGDDPPPLARYETAIASKTANKYGNIKLEQERLVIKYGRRHRLPFVILRPPNVYGPYSRFTLAILQKLKAGTLPVVDGGTNTCNLVYIDNLIEAILLSLASDKAVGEIFFITDKDRVTWRKCLEDHGALLGLKVPEATSSQVDFPSSSPPMLAESLRQVPVVFFSGELRSALRRIPAVAAVEKVLYDRYMVLPEKYRNCIRFKVTTAPKFSRPNSGPSRYDGSDSLIAAQRRAVEHSCEKAEKLVGYSASVNSLRAMAITKKWLTFAKVV